MIFAIGQASYADSQRSNKLNKVKQSRQRVGVNYLDMSNELPKRHLSDSAVSDSLSGKQNVCASQTSDNNDLIRMLEAMRSDITSLKTELSNLKQCNKGNERGELGNEGRNQRAREHQELQDKGRCTECRQNMLDESRHCFVCWGLGHRARRGPSVATGNDSRLRK